jgi:hypothetical protein
MLCRQEKLLAVSGDCISTGMLQFSLLVTEIFSYCVFFEHSKGEIVSVHLSQPPQLVSMKFGIGGVPGCQVNLILVVIL